MHLIPTLLLTLAILTTAGCTRGSSSSDVLITTNHSIVYEASVSQVQLEYSLDDFVDSMLKASSGESNLPTRDTMMRFYQTESNRNELEKMLLNQQLQFMIGSLKATGGNIAQPDFKILSKNAQEVKGSADKSVEKTVIVYDASFLLTVPREVTVDLGHRIATYFPRNMDLSARQALLTRYAGCFNQDQMHAAMSQHSAWEAMIMFYYYVGENEKCPLAGSADWEPVTPSTQLSPRQMTEQHYPEIDRIWQDGRFVATLIFTPTEDYKDTDEGMYGYAKMVQLLTSQYGTPLEGEVPAALMGEIGSARPTRQPTITLTYKLNDGRMLVFHLMAWQTHWQNNATLKQTFGDLSRESDFISYNGHADYGNNVKLMEEWSLVEKGHYQVFYLDGCSTFAYISKEMSNKVQQVNPSEAPSKNLDIIGNISPSYFAKMPEQNFYLIDGMIRGNESYSAMFAKIEAATGQNYSSNIVVIGEEDNTYKP